MAKREEASSFHPSSRQPSRNRGRLRAMTALPTGMAGTMAWMICPRPVIPPKVIWLGT